MLNEHVRYFLFGGITNNPAMNILGELFNIYAMSVSRSGITGSWNMCIISFTEKWQNSIQSHWTVIPFHQLFYIFANICNCLFHSAHLSSVLVSH